MACEGRSCIKLLFFVVNFLACIFGALVCGVSLWANLDKNFGTHLADFVRQIDHIDQKVLDEIAEYQASLWILVAVGALIFAVGFFGCIGAGCESPVLLGMFIFVVIILAIVQLGAIAFAITNKAVFLSSIDQVLENSSSTPALRRNIKPIQDIFKCCGATQKTQPLYINDGLCGPNLGKYPESCSDRITHMIQSSGEAIIVAVFILFGVQLFAVLFACILCRSSRYSGYSRQYS